MEFRYYKIESKQHDDVRIYDPDGNLLSNVISCDIHMEAGDLHSATIKILNTKEEILVPEHKVNIKKKSIIHTTTGTNMISEKRIFSKNGWETLKK